MGGAMVVGRSTMEYIGKSKTYHELWDKSPIEACVKAIEWLTANNYKLNEL